MKLKIGCLALLLLGSVQTGWAQSIHWGFTERLVRRTFPEVEQISTDSLAAWLADDTRPGPVLLDTRPAAEYAVSHLPGALRVDPEADDFAFLGAMDRATPIVTYCSVGYRSSGVAERLRAAGFTNVSNLEGSIFRWANEGRPVYRGGAVVRQVHPYDRTWRRLLDDHLHAYAPDSTR